MNTATRYTRILVSYLTIGVIFAAALSGGQRNKVPAPCPLLIFAKFSEQSRTLLSLRD
ncbi:hypothetical protein [Roseimicrobium sp. ORNL1]|uniref:hypothetical protein n=1 Tax=Roseimicrobium sp. ORNL1 TaxID=2711231 RepID=UPI0013E1235A|nr:hypothetical protein [Roseimicrobium sp. ORNL1]QIF04607.1 hypothetical protein G5S37_24785 [Roseimicrobium sp. ORNL1]